MCCSLMYILLCYVICACLLFKQPPVSSLPGGAPRDSGELSPAALLEEAEEEEEEELDL